MKWLVFLLLVFPGVAFGQPITDFEATATVKGVKAGEYFCLNEPLDTICCRADASVLKCLAGGSEFTWNGIALTSPNQMLALSYYAGVNTNGGGILVGGFGVPHLVGSSTNQTVFVTGRANPLLGRTPASWVVPTHPTLAVWSDTDWNTDSTQWIGLYHDTTDGILKANAGAIELHSGGTAIVDVDGTVSPDKVTINGDLVVTGTISSATGTLHAFMSTYDNSTATTINTQDVWEEIDNFTSQSVNGWVISGSDMTAGTGAAGKYIISWSLSATAATPNQDFEFAVSVDDTVQTSCLGARRFTTSDTGSIAGHCTLDLSASEVLKIETRNRTGTANITIKHGQVNVHQL